MVSKSDIEVRWMIRKDIPAVMAIENDSFEHSWSEDDLLSCMRQRSVIGMVADRNGQIAGFMVYEFHKHRLHILNFAVAREHRRTGVGRAMLNKLIGKLSPERRTRIMLEVRETNLNAQLFFKACGFRAVSILSGFWDDHNEDACLMQYRVADVIHERASGVNRITSVRGSA